MNTGVNANTDWLEMLLSDVRSDIEEAARKLKPHEWSQYQKKVKAILDSEDESYVKPERRALTQATT